ncbi:MAG: lactate/malate family dehydrogenase [Solirubrobacterales bacterium]
MIFYKYKEKILLSKYKYDFEETDENALVDYKGNIYVLNKLPVEKSRMCYKASSLSQLFIEDENLKLINETVSNLPKWLKDAVIEGRVMCINTNYQNYLSLIDERELKDKSVVTITGMGDVGGILTTGLRLLGNGSISKINIYDKDINKIRRFELECNAILPGDFNENYPNVSGIDESDLFNCDMFVFCVSTGVPEVGKEDVDVRIAQLKGNSNIISHYAKLARANNFKGIFAVVSDPVDLLCKAAYIESNMDNDGNFDYLGLKPDQIKGYGLGVMYARAAYYAKDINEDKSFLREGRAYGPHGEDLVIANSISSYNERNSLYLTEKARKSNLEVRAAGFKPYIAPALSSGSLSLIATLKGDWHYSTNFIGGAYFGCKNRETSLGIEFECCSIPENLFKKLEITYKNLKDFSIEEV